MPARGREREHQRGESGVARERERRLVAGVAREREASGGVAREGERAGVSGERVVGGVGRERGERVDRRGRMGNSGKIVAYESWTRAAIQGGIERPGAGRSFRLNGARALFRF